VHYKQTLPWADEGWRLLSNANFMTYTDAMRAEKAKFTAAVDEFISRYPTLKAEAPAKLGKLYRASDYPNVATVRARFDWSIEFKPVPSRGDVRCELPAEALEMVEASIVARVERATREAMVDAWKRLHEAVMRIKNASAPDGVVRENLIAHAKETVELLGRLNVSQDQDLDAMRKRVLKELTVIEVEDLRTDDKLRKDTEKRANAIIKAMGAFFTPQAESSDDDEAAA
jgi:hypothetical protein